MIYLPTIVLFTITFIHFVQSVCVTDSNSILSGNYINSGTHNNKPYYTLTLNSNCQHTSAILYYSNYYSKWTISFDQKDGPNHYYTAICSSKTETPQKCSSWSTASGGSISVSSKQCETLCPKSNTLVISSSSIQSVCTGTFTIVSDQNNNNIFANSHGYYWYFNYPNKMWVCYQYGNQYDQGCSVAGYHLFNEFGSIKSLGKCSSESTPDTTAPDTTASSAPIGSTSCSSVTISGSQINNNIVNGEWNQYKNGLINNKPYFTKGEFYLYFMGGCNFNRWIISGSLNNRDIDYDSTGNCYAESYYAQCQQNTADITDCSGHWEIAGSVGFVLDSNVITEKSASC